MTTVSRKDPLCCSSDGGGAPLPTGVLSKVRCWLSGRSAADAISVNAREE